MTTQRWTNPLKAWRLTQLRWDPVKRVKATLTITRASGEYGVPYQTWAAWEKDQGDPLFRRPDADNMRKLFVFTRGQVRPDHYFDLPELRDAIAAARDAGLIEAGG